MWIVITKKRIIKKINKLPKDIQQLYKSLVADLELEGPEQPSWSNYSKLGKNEYHCHLNYHYVACWEVDKNKNLTLEVYYVGSRESAPY